MEVQLLTRVCNLLERKLVSLAIDRPGRSFEDEQYRAFCALCAAEMIEIVDSVQNETNCLYKKTAKSIKSLLRNLERVCSYSSKKPKRAAIGQQQKLSHPSGSDQSRSLYPSLQALASVHDTSKIPRHVSDGIESFVMSDERCRLLDCLKRISHRLRNHHPDESSFEPVQVDDTDCDPPDHRHQIKQLFHTVARHRVCNCEPKYQGPIATYLGLNEQKIFVHVEENITPFKLFFTRHSPEICTTEPASRLRETVMRIKKSRRVNVPNESTDPLPTNHLTKIHNNFCSVISRANSLLSLYFFIQDDNLQLEGPKAQSKNWITDCHISLTELFSTKGFFTSRKKRLHLSHLVAKATWECYDSGWIQDGLLRQNVHFLLEKSDCGRHKQLSTDEPFLKASFVDPDTESPCWHDPISRCLNLHKCPKILALGILLLEIELGHGIDEYRHLILEENQIPDVNTDYMTAVHVLDRMSEGWEERGTTSQHKAIIKACFNQEMLRGYEDADSQRLILLKEVVVPLDSLFRSQWEGEESEILPIIYEDILPGSIHAKKAPRVSAIIRHLPPAQCPVPQPLEPSSNSAMPLPGSTMYSALRNASVHTLSHASARSTSTELPSTKWLETIDREFCAPLRAKKKDRKSYKPVKIAVLDTGIDPQHYNIIHIAGYKDFVNSSSQTHVDLTGHGSIGVSLIYKVLPNSQVYVARVFETSKAKEDTPALLAKAIRHARNEWNVDLITIASGFDDYHDCIRDEIISETSNPPLIFSAASNSGNMGPIAFPASMRQCVMCMFASNGHSKPTQLPINPSAQESGGSNFAVLGEDVEIQFSPAEESIRHSGTSIATFIGAAIAGVLLDFSKQPICQQLINPCHLKKVGGMSAVFRKMSVEDNGYNCITPWSLLRGIRIPISSHAPLKDPMAMKQKELGKKISNLLIDAGM